MMFSRDMQADSFFACRLRRILFFSHLHLKMKRWKEKEEQKDPSCRLSDVLHNLMTDRKVKERTVVQQVMKYFK